jgi:hypothetical protein
MALLVIGRPASRIKIACAKRGTKMADEIRTLVEKHFFAD